MARRKHHRSRGRRRAARENPTTGQWLLLGGLAVLGVGGYFYWKSKQTPAQLPAATGGTTANTTNTTTAAAIR